MEREERGGDVTDRLELIETALETGLRPNPGDVEWMTNKIKDLRHQVQQMKKLVQEQKEIMVEHLDSAKEMHRQNNEYSALFDEIVRSVASLRREQAR